MEIFSEKCEGEDYKNNKLFLEWHDAIKTDLNRFKIMLEQYSDSEEKNKLLMMIDNIRNNISNEFDEGNFILMKSTVEYFLFSFYDDIASDMPTYVLLSRDYKRLLVAAEEMECFDDEEFNEDERYGIYHYDYFYLEDDKVKYYHKETKEYTQDYTVRFDNSYFYTSDFKEAEEYYDFLLKKPNIVKKINLYNMSKV